MTRSGNKSQMHFKLKVFIIVFSLEVGTINYINIITTTKRESEAKRISGALLESRLAACVQIIGPVKSSYIWRGRIENSREWLLLIKSRKNLYRRVEGKIKSLHSYDTPEIIALPVIAGSEKYTRWLGRVLRA